MIHNIVVNHCFHFYEYDVRYISRWKLEGSWTQPHLWKTYWGSPSALALYFKVGPGGPGEPLSISLVLWVGTWRRCLEGDLSRNQAGCQEIMQPGSNWTEPYQHGTDWKLEELIIWELEGYLPCYSMSRATQIGTWRGFGCVVWWRLLICCLEIENGS